MTNMTLAGWNSWFEGNKVGLYYAIYGSLMLVVLFYL